MNLLESLELQEEGVERAQVLERGGVDVEDRGQGETEEEVVGRAAGEPARLEVGQTTDVGAGEVRRVEPVDAAFVAALG